MSMENMESAPDEKMEEAVSAVIDQFKQAGDTMLAYNGEYVYGCKEEEIPDGAVDSYTEIDSEEAREWVKRSMEQGHSYGNVQSPNKEQ